MNTTRLSRQDYYLSLGGVDSDDFIIPPGTPLSEGRFRIDKLLGKGSRADVYLAEDTLRNGYIALKMFRNINDDDRLEEVGRELKIISNIDDEHIIKVYDAHKFSFNGYKLFAIAMEYADGGNLRDWLQHKHLDLENRRTLGLDIVGKICKVVGKLHDSGIVHLDIKPDNILFLGTKPKLADFGFASSGRRNKTKGSYGGTAEYASPEQLMEDHPVDTAADVYAIGVILYEIMHPQCNLPFSGNFDYLKTIKTCQLPTRIDDINDDLWKVILTCMQINPAKRYRNANQLLEAIDMISSRQSHCCDLWKLICRQIETGDLIIAHHNCRQLLNTAPDHADAFNLLQQLDSRCKQAADIYNSISRDLRNNPFDVSWSLCDQAERLYPGHPQAHATLSALKHAIHEYNTLFKEGIRHISEKNRDMALVCFQRARTQFPGQIKASELEQMLLNYHEYEKDSIRRINELIRQHDFQTALDIAGEFDRYAQDIQEKARQICSEF